MDVKKKGAVLLSTNFSYECSSQEATAVPLQWIGETPRQDKAKFRSAF